MNIKSLQEKFAAEVTKHIGDESFDVEFMDGTFYVKTSELGALRCLRVWRENTNARMHYSENLQTYIFALDTTLTAEEY